VLAKNRRENLLTHVKEARKLVEDAFDRALVGLGLPKNRDPLPAERITNSAKQLTRVAHRWSWDIGSSTSAAQTSLNMVRSRRKARPFGLSTKWGLQESERPSPKGRAPWPGPCSMD